jgi:hypothetical protein
MKGLTCCNWNNAMGAADAEGICGEMCTLSVGNPDTEPEDGDEKGDEKGNDDGTDPNDEKASSPPVAIIAGAVAAVVAVAGIASAYYTHSGKGHGRSVGSCIGTPVHAENIESQLGNAENPR